jgi:aspartate/methionine/tyrosine aminotransferase
MLYEINEKALKLESEGKNHSIKPGRPRLGYHQRLLKRLCFDESEQDQVFVFLRRVELRQKIAEVHGVKAENVVVTPGSNGHFATMFLMLKNGGNVIIPTPYWTAYDLIAKSLGAKPSIAH